MGKDSAIHKSVAGEQLSRASSVRMPELTEKQKQAEEVSYLQEEKSYLQGYVDCVYLLSGLGLLKKDEFVDKFIEELRK